MMTTACVEADGAVWTVDLVDGAHDMCYKVATSLEARTALRLQQ